MLTHRDEASARIRELGAIPQNEYETIKSDSKNQLTKKLSEVKETLSQFSSLNKKAREQYTMFKEQKSSLGSRKEELDNSKASINQLLNQLDLQKGEAIERTFKGVAKSFSETFNELVPGGSASLIMQKKPATTSDSLSQSQSESQFSEPGSKRNRDASTQSQTSSRVDTYSGVAVRVVFPGTTESLYIQELSGGQKAIVALALVFAIQRTDPSPFYLFDEVDAALDQSNRQAVANLIQKESESSQFIISTFRPECVQCANKCYGIKIKAKASTFEPISKEEALNFIVDNTNGVQNEEVQPDQISELDN